MRSTTEVIKRGREKTEQDLGCDVYLNNVSLKCELDDYSILASESQERMLVVVKKGQEKEVNKIFQKWDLNCKKIGHITRKKDVVFYYNKTKVAQIPANSLVLGGGAPIYEREYNTPSYFEEFKK